MMAWRFVVDGSGCVKVTVKTKMNLNKKILIKEGKSSVYNQSL